MKAVMLKNIIDEGREYKKGQIIDVYHDPEVLDFDVYSPYKENGKTYRHWFNVINLPWNEDYAEVKIIDDDGYDIEEAIKIITARNKEIMDRNINLFREAFGKGVPR